MLAYPKRKHFPIESIICWVEAWVWWLTAGIFCTRDRMNSPSRQLNQSPSADATTDAASVLNDDWIICVWTLCITSHLSFAIEIQVHTSQKKKRSEKGRGRKKLRRKSNESDSYTFPTVRHSLIALDIFAQFDFDHLFSRVMNILFTIIQPRWSMPIFTDFNKSFSHPQFYLTCVSSLWHALLLDAHTRLSINQCIYFVEELTLLHKMHSTSRQYTLC